MKDNDEKVQALLELEQLRAKALVAKDFDVLRRFIPKDLHHVHTTGKIDSYESYFKFLENDFEFIRVERGPLNVLINGESAVMTGLQSIEFRAIGAEEIKSINAYVTQVWFKRDGKWFQVAFQATTAT